MKRKITSERFERLWERTSITETTAEVEFKDVNGQHSARVGVDGDFWRVVTVDVPAFGITPKEARQVAKAIVRAADRVEREERARTALRKLAQKNGVEL